MWSGSPFSRSKSRGEWLWKRWPAALFSLASKASLLNLLLECLYSARTLALVGARTQSKRRSTVIGSMTRSYWGGRYGPRSRSAICQIRFEK